MGFFSSGQFNLVVSIRYAPAAGEMAYWCTFLEQVSRILHDATDGAQSIGPVLISGNSMGGADADIWIHPNSDVWPNSTSARLWFPTESLDVSQDYMFYATILAHELSHYLYDLRDEYNNGSVCLGDITTEASMMEGYAWNNYTRWTDAAGNDYPDWATFFPDFTGGVAVLQLGQPSEFCHDGNHNATANNNQNNINGNQSCWTYMANDANHNDIPYGLAAPGAGGPATAPPPLPAAIVCTELIPVQRFMLVLDRSFSMFGAKIEQLKIGANFWVDYVNPLEELGIVTYSTTETLDSSMSEAPADPVAAATWRDDRHGIVDGIVAAGATAIGDAMRAGLNDIIAGGRASSQVMILFTDGLQNAGAETAEDVLPDLVAAGVRCYTIGLGSDQDAALLTNVATTTGATYFPIAGDLSPEEAATAITEALIEVAGESRENGGIVSFNDVDGASAGAVVAEDSVPFNWPGEGQRPRPDRPTRRTSFRFPVEISAGSTHCTLGALWKNPKQKFGVKIFDPNGAPVGPGPKVRWVKGKYPYSFYEINNPKAGVWHVEVSGAAIAQGKFRTIGFEVNNRIRLEVSAISPHIRLGEDIRLRARVLTPQAVPGAKLTGWLHWPSGKWTTFKFVEHKGAAGDKEEPFVYTATIKGAKERGQYLIAVDAARAKGTFELELDELYRRKPGLKPQDMKRKFQTPKLKRRKFLSVVADRQGRSREEPVAGHNTKGGWVHKKQRELLKRWREKHQLLK